MLSKRKLLCYHDRSLATAVEERNEGFSYMSNDEESLSHTKWNWKHYRVFVAKMRRQVIYGRVKADLETTV